MSKHPTDLAKRTSLAKSIAELDARLQVTRQLSASDPLATANLVKANVPDAAKAKAIAPAAAGGEPAPTGEVDEDVAAGGEPAVTGESGAELRKLRAELSLSDLNQLGGRVTKIVIGGLFASIIVVIVAFRVRADDALQRACRVDAGENTKDLDACASETLPFELWDGLFIASVVLMLLIWWQTSNSRPGPRPAPNGEPEKQKAALESWFEQRDRFQNRSVAMAVSVGLVVVAAIVVRNQALEHGVPEQLVARHSALVLTLLVLSLLLWLLAGLRSREGGLLDYIVGNDNRFSTSYLQAALWSVAITFAVLLIVLTRVFVTPVNFDHLLDEFDTTYLLLLGGPFAALVGARAITGAAIDDQKVQKVEAAEASFKQVLTDDAGRTDLVDAQFLLFNAVALVAFVAMFAAAPDDLPKLPAGLAALTTVSGLAYLGTKATLKNAPVILSVGVVGDGAIVPGCRIVVRGQNFVPAGAEDVELRRQVIVKFGAVQVAGGTDASPPASDRIEVTVPEGVKPDAGSDVVLISVVTAFGAETAPYPTRFSLPVPSIGAVNPSVISPLARVTVNGTNFDRPGSVGAPIVVLSGRRLVTVESTNTSVTFVVPPDQAATPAMAKLHVISASGEASAEVDVPVRVTPPVITNVDPDGESKSIVVSGSGFRRDPDDQREVPILRIGGVPVATRYERAGASGSLTTIAALPATQLTENAIITVTNGANDQSEPVTYDLSGLA